MVGAEERKGIALGAADSVKRVRTRKLEEKLDWSSGKSQGVYDIKDFIEFKTTWHPIGV